MLEPVFAGTSRPVLPSAGTGMEVPPGYLDTLIAGQHRAARWYVIASASIVVFGLFLLGLPLVFSSALNGEYLKLALSVGGGFIASAAAFPAREIVAIRNRIDLYSHFRARLAECSPEESAQIHTIVWTAVGKVAGT